jgi:small-conductance mechanosensitive channel/CRP-like cAMP-binding protein
LIENASSLLAGALLGVSLLNWRVARSRPVWYRVATNAVLLLLLTAAVLLTAGSPLEPQFTEAVALDRLSQQILVTLWWVLGARLLVELICATAVIKQFSIEGRMFPDLVAGLVYLAVLLTIVKTVFSFPIGGLVATSGIIAIVLGLALQSTLSDVFAGIAVGIERPFAIGDLVWVEGPIEGEIVQINWRSVQIRTFGNDIATVPNSLVAKSRIVNRSVPTKRRSDTVHVACDAALAPERVFELIEWAVLLCPDILETPPASVALGRLGQRTNGYEVAFSVADSGKLWRTKSMLLKEVLRQLRSAGPAEEPAASDPQQAGSHAARTPLAQRILDIPLFEAVPAESRSRLADQIERRALISGEVLFSEGDSESSLFIVASGVLEVTRMVGGTVTRVGRISAGDYIGEIGLLTGEPHAASVRALTPCLVFELRKSHIAPMLSAEPRLLHALELSANRGRELIARSVAASVGTRAVPAAQLLDRMRAFFHLLGH